MSENKRVDKEKLLEKVYNRGFELEQRYDGCAQCVVAALQDYFPVNSALVKAATSFSGGIASTSQGPCGALSGGIMLLSFFLGRPREEFSDIGLLRRPGPVVRAFWEQFTKKYGGDSCSDVQHYLFGTSYCFLDSEEHRQYEEAGGIRDKCPAVVGQSAAWVTELLLESNVPVLKK
ncbi:MAG: C-GCAxxG-C-C family protein [Bacillota bacterium]